MEEEPQEGYVLTDEDCDGLMAVRASTAAMGEFAVKIGAPEAARNYEKQVTWLDGFMDRIGATDMLARRREMRESYSIDTSREERDERN